MKPKKSNLDPSEKNRRPRVFLALSALALASIAALGCDSGKAPAKPPAPESRPAPKVSAAPSLAPVDPTAASRFPGAGRIVAIGDLHGDLSSTRDALRLAGAVDESDRWIGGSLILVQTGDELDRGDDERAIVDLFERLKDEAARAGGAVYALNGNHEIMNVAGDFRYVTRGGYRDFANVSGLSALDPKLSGIPEDARPRAAALFPGGPYAKILAKRNTIIIVGDTVFAHGGVLPEHVSYGIDRLNREVSAWMNGDSRSPPPIVMAEDAPVWTRLYGEGDLGKNACATLDQALSALRVKRMVIGHTVQKGGVTSACEGKVWRIDVGLAAYYGGPTEVLEIVGAEARAVKQGAGAVPAAAPTASSKVEPARSGGH